VAETLHALEQLPTVQVLTMPGTSPARQNCKALMSRRWRSGLVAIAGAALATVLALSVVLWPTPRGTVRIESDDPAVEVVFGKDGPTIKGADKEPISLRAGEHGVRIQRGDFTFEADKLVLKKGAALTLKVELLQGKVQVMQDGRVVASQDMPLPAPPGANRGDRLAGWLQEVAALPAEEQVKAVGAKLKDLNPGFDGRLTRNIEPHGVRVELVSDHVTNFTPLRGLTGVSVLSCAGSAEGKGHLADLETIRSMRLIGLNCFYTNVADLAPLSGMKLIYLDCSGTAVTDLEPLRGMPMQYLYCRQTPGIKSLAPLEGMPLRHFDLYSSRIADLSPLRGMKLERLWLGSNLVTDLAVLRGMPMKILDIDTTSVADLAPLRGMPLEFLDCHDTPVADLAPLQGMKLTELHCGRTKVADLAVLRGMPLKILSCDFQAERDAAILHSINTLEQINGKSAAEFWKEVDARPGAQKP
jgi:hypothetical protein